MTKEIINLQIESEHAGERLDRVLAAVLPDCSRSYLQKLIKNGAVRCGGSVCTAQRTAVKTGDEITVRGSKAQGSDGIIYLMAQKITDTTQDVSVVLRDESGRPAWAGNGR